MAVAQEISVGASRSDKQFNFGACLIDAVGWPLGAAFFSQTTLLPTFLRHLGASNTVVGALPALYALLMFLPGLLVAGFVARLRRARGYLFWVALGERLALLPLVWLTPLWAFRHPAWLICALFACFTVHGVALGVNQPAYWVVVAKCIPVHWRGRLFGFAGGLAGLFGLGLDRVLSRLLSGPGGGFPLGYSRAFLIGFLILLFSYMPLGIVREPPTAAKPADDPHAGHHGRDSLFVWRTNTGFRRFLIAQAVFYGATLATPFFVLDAGRRLHAGPAALAGYTATLVLAASFGSLGWGAWGDRSGNKVVLLASTLCAVFAGVGAALAPTAGAFYAVFAASALALAGVGIAGSNVTMEYAGSAREIALYTALYNAVTALPRALAPLLGGLLADLSGGHYTVVFLLSAALALLSLVLTLRVQEPRREQASNGYTVPSPTEKNDAGP